SPDSARFTLPNGLAFDDASTQSPTLYVADTFNHAIRAVSLDTGAVRTLAGTGRRVRTRAELAAGAMASPWDLALVGRTLYVAMAGSHQLWALDLDSNVMRVHAGAG